MWCLGFKGIAHLGTFWRRLYFSGGETVYSILYGKKLLGSRETEQTSMAGVEAGHHQEVF